MMIDDTVMSLADAWWGDHMSGWGGWWMTLVMLAFWGVVVWGVVAIVRTTDRDSRERRRPEGNDVDEYRERRDAP